MDTRHSPSTPNRTPLQRAVLQRSFTVPANITSGHVRSGSGSAQSVETLFVHPSAKVVSFTTGLRSAANTPSAFHGAESAAKDPPLLPWQYPNERILAAGHLEIYTIPGSVSFLHSGTLLHAILPRSQCWCVDGTSKFAFRVLPETYYRIELPAQSDQDKDRIAQLKTTLKKVLCYERTPCPFERGFHVDITPTSNEKLPPRHVMARPAEPAKKWKLDGIWRPEDQVWARRLESQTGRPCSNRQLSDESLTTAQPGLSPHHHLPHVRSVTAPPVWNLPSSTSETPAKQLDQSQGPGQGFDAVTTLQTESHVDTPSLPPVSSSIGSDQLQENVTGAITETTRTKTKTSLCSLPTSTPSSSPPLSNRNLNDDDDFWGGTVTVSSPVGSLRPRRARKGNQLLPLSPSPEITRALRSTSISKATQDMLTDGLVAKSCAMFLGPPAHLVTLMLRIAATIASGALSMSINSPAGADKRVPGSWELSDDEDEWDMSDYGFPLGTDRA